MPAILLLIVVIGAVYQFFFRYEHWTGGADQKTVYELDHLTGKTYALEPGQQQDFIARITGKIPAQFVEEGALTMNATATTSAGLSAPVPAVESSQGVEISDEWLDLNGDGQFEEIIRRKSATEGLLDISVIADGEKEIFYGQGQQVRLLDTAEGKWKQLALTRDSGDTLYYRYNPGRETYELSATDRTAQSL